MNRIIAIKAIAVILILLGVWNIVYSLMSFFSAPTNQIQINIYISISMPFLFYAGFNLFQLKESGRKLTLALFLFQTLINSGVLAWVLLQKGESFQFWINLLDEKYVFTEDRNTFAVIMLVLSFTQVLMIAFLLQKRTKEIFSP